MGRKKTRIEPGKNALWQLYQDADDLVRDEIQLELRKGGKRLVRYWQQTASVAGYDLFFAAAPLKEIFLRLLPESAPHFEQQQSHLVEL